MAFLGILERIGMKNFDSWLTHDPASDFELPEFPFGTVAYITHDDYLPAMKTGTKVIILRISENDMYDYEIALINLDGDCETTFVRYGDINVPDPRIDYTCSGCSNYPCCCEDFNE
jgi:hypothetical protein